MNEPDIKTHHPQSDKRHSRRVVLVQQLYAASFDKNQTDFTGHPHFREEFDKIIEKLAIIDETIQKHASKYPLENVARTDLAILRLAVYELILEKSEPPKVIINEAVELAKELGSDRSYAFVNGALGAILGESQESKSEF